MKSSLYFNGNIITMENEDYAEAVFVKDGIIKYAGKEKKAMELVGEKTELIDLRGKTLMPSFVDSHSHITAYASTLTAKNLSGAKSFDEVVEMMRDFRKKSGLKAGEWMIGYGYDHNFLQEMRHPDRNILDEVSRENPILITHASGHMGVANSYALRINGVDKSSKDPAGGRIGRDTAAGEPDGYLEENAFMEFSKKIPPVTKEKMEEFMQEAEREYLKYGVTTVQDGRTQEKDFRLLCSLAEEGKLHLDVVAYIDLKNDRAAAQKNKRYIGSYKNHLKIGGYKIFLDGSPQGRTAWLSKPYENGEDGYCGYPIYTNSEVEAFIEQSIQDNMQLLTHCNGDAASQQLIDACYGLTQKDREKLKGLRPVMIHAQTVRHDQIDKMGDIGMIPSFFISHIYHWGDIHIQNLGMERASRISAAGRAYMDHIPFTFHTDSPVIAPNMLEAVWCAVNRRTKKGVLLGGEEQLTVREALKAITIYGAYQYFEEDEKGSIREGKKADFVILDRDPLCTDKEELRDIRVLSTIKDDRVLYSII